MLWYYFCCSSPFPLALAPIEADFAIGFDDVPTLGELVDGPAAAGDGRGPLVLIIGIGVEDPDGLADVAIL